MKEVRWALGTVMMILVVGLTVVLFVDASVAGNKGRVFATPEQYHFKGANGKKTTINRGFLESEDGYTLDCVWILGGELNCRYLVPNLWGQKRDFLPNIEE